MLICNGEKLSYVIRKVSHPFLTEPSPCLRLEGRLYALEQWCSKSSGDVPGVRSAFAEPAVQTDTRKWFCYGDCSFLVCVAELARTQQ